MLNELNLGLLFLSAFLVNNILLIRFIALCSFFGLSNSLNASLGMGMAVTFVMVMTSAVSWGLYHYVLVPFHLEYLRTTAFILTIATLVQFEEIIIHKKAAALYKAMGIYLPLITTNCAILAAAFLGIDYKLNFVQNVVYSLAVSLGYTLAILLFAGVRERVDTAPVPDNFKGMPIAFITASLMSLAFLGFKGLFKL